MKIKNTVKKFLPRKIFNELRDLLYPEKINILEERLASLFLTQYKDLASPEISQKISFKNAEFKIFSKHGNDGILLNIFSKIGVTNRMFVEVGTEDGRECNTSNLSLNLGWNGLMIDGNKEWLESARKFFDKKLGEGSERIKMESAYVTAENIDSLLKKNNIEGEIDLFSLDIDGNDYWVWKKMSAIRPRVVVLEYNPAFGNDSITIPYDGAHRFKPDEVHSLYFGASLSALTKISKQKGYILVGCDSHGHDAFFVREDVAKNKFIELKPEYAFYPNPFTLRVYGSIEKQLISLKHLPLENV